MPPLKRTLLALSLAVALALGVAACGGGSNLLSGTTASEINSNLERVRELVSEGDCAGAEEAVAEVKSQVDELEGVDARLKEALEEGALRLEAVVSLCEEAGEEETEPNEAEEPEELEEKAEKTEREPKPEREPPEKESTEPAEPTTPEETEEPEAPEETEAPSGGVGPGAAVGEG